MCEKITCDHCHEKFDSDEIVDLQERIGYNRIQGGTWRSCSFYGDDNRCTKCTR